MTATCPLSNLQPWETQAIPALPAAAKRLAPAHRSRHAPPRPASLHPLWRDALAEEDRVVAPFERMGFGLLAFAAGTALTASVAASLRFVELLPNFTAWAGRLLGGG
jgi:hypothetical protein